MEITFTNKSSVSSESLKEIVDFLAPCYGKLDMPVHITFRSKKSHTYVSGVAYYPAIFGNLDRNPKGTYNVSVIIGATNLRSYPFVPKYKVRAGHFEIQNAVEFLFHTTAHELAHVAQFAAVRHNDPKARSSMIDFKKSFKSMERFMASGSCEVDAERTAHGLTAAYRSAVQAGIHTEDQFFVRLRS